MKLIEILIFLGFKWKTKFHVLAENVQENMAKQDDACYLLISAPHPIVSICWCVIILFIEIE